MTQVGTGVKSSLSDDIKAAGVEGTLTYVAMPLSKNKLLFRFENLADLMDGDSKTQNIDGAKLFNAIYTSANGSANTVSTKVTEMSLTANMSLKEMRDRKVQWKTMDDDKLTSKPFKISDGESISLMPQQIRVFVVEFETTEAFL